MQLGLREIISTQWFSRAGSRFRRFIESVVSETDSVSIIIYTPVFYILTPFFIICPITRERNPFASKTLQRLIRQFCEVFRECFCSRSSKKGVEVCTHSPALKPCGFHLWVMVGGRMHRNNHHTVDDLKEKKNIQNVAS